MPGATGSGRSTSARPPASPTCVAAPVGQPRGRHGAAGRRARLRRRRTAVRRRLRLDGPAAPSRTAGRPPPARRTSGAARPASACCWSARARAGATPSPATTGSTSGSRASRTSRPRWAPPPRCRRWSPSATRSTPASTRWSTGSGPRWPTIPDVEVVGDPVDRLPHLVTFSCLYVDGEALVDALDRRGFAVASGSACTASTLEPSHVLAAMGVLTHGNVRVSLTRDTTEADVDGVPAPCSPRSSPSPRGGRTCDRRPRARLPRAALPAAGHRAGPADRRRRGRRGSSRSPRPTRPRPTTCRRGAGCAGRSTSARTPPTTGCRATWSRQLPQPERRVRCGRTTSAASPP